MTLTFWCLINQVFLAHAANILGVIPTASYSHQAPFQPIWRELALRGHKVTVLTTNPQKNASLTNLREIDMSSTYRIYERYDIWTLLSNDSLNEKQKGDAFGKVVREAQILQMSLPEVRALIEDHSVNFDLLIVEAQIAAYIAFAWRFRCPVIGVTSLDTAMEYHDALGNPLHPIVTPYNNLNILDGGNLTFFERVYSVIFNMLYKYYMYTKSIPRDHELMKDYFGEDLPPLTELQQNMSMLFLGTHPIFHGARPLNPNTIAIGGGLHLREKKSLPEDLQNFLDESPNGVVYFSLGSNLKPVIMNEGFKNVLRATFTELPYRVIMKLDDQLDILSENVLVRKWVPQQDVLRHPNVKLFITQGGLQSLQESISNGIPVVGIPFCGDQNFNMNRVVVHGYGIKLNKNNVTRESLKYAISEVIENSKYLLRAKELSNIFNDEEISSLDRAVYWTEYVIRHKGAKHLRSSASGMPAWKYFLLDVAVFLGTSLLLVVLLSYVILRTVFSLFSISRIKYSKMKNKRE